MMARIRFHLPEDEIDVITYGEWVDAFNTYKFIYNFETKKMLYADAEEYTKRWQQEHRKIDNPMDL